MTVKVKFVDGYIGNGEIILKDKKTNKISKFMGNTTLKGADYLFKLFQIE